MSVRRYVCVLALCFALFGSAHAQSDAGRPPSDWTWSDIYRWLMSVGWTPPPVATQGGSVQTTTRSVPEFDPTAAGSIAAMLAGGALLLKGRRRR